MILPSTTLTVNFGRKFYLIVTFGVQGKKFPVLLKIVRENGKFYNKVVLEKKIIN